MTNEIVNVVASTQLTEALDLYDVADIMEKDYEAEQFPGLTYRVEDPKVCDLERRLLREPSPSTTSTLPLPPSTPNSPRLVSIFGNTRMLAR